MWSTSMLLLLINMPEAFGIEDSQKLKIETTTCNKCKLHGMCRLCSPSQSICTGCRSDMWSDTNCSLTKHVVIM